MSAFAERGTPWLNRPDGREEDDSVTWRDIALDMVAWGNPDTVLEKLVWLRDVIGDFGTVTFTAHEWSNVDIDRRSMKLLAEDVMPKFSQHVDALRVN